MSWKLQSTQSPTMSGIKCQFLSTNCLLIIYALFPIGQLFNEAQKTKIVKSVDVKITEEYQDYQDTLHRLLLTSDIHVYIKNKVKR